MQPVHACTRFGAPPTMARTRCTFGFQRRLVRRCEWETDMPQLGCFPQMSQTAAMALLPDVIDEVLRSRDSERPPEAISAGSQPTKLARSSRPSDLSMRATVRGDGRAPARYVRSR